LADLLTVALIWSLATDLRHKPESAERPGVATATQAEQWNQELEDVYAQTAPTICKTGKRSLWQLARLVERHHGAYGESFTILSDRFEH
jgi:hypothetical protein